MSVARLAGSSITRAIRSNPAKTMSAHQTRHISLLTPRRPTLPATTPFNTSITAPTLSSSNPSQIPALCALDLAPKPSTHPAMASLQIRCGPRDTFSPSHLVRKRRHGFLSRIRTRKGVNTLKRRRAKGRKNLSH